jgi:Fe-S-cluster containining protein
MEEQIVDCIGCGECCSKHWLLRLTGNHEKNMFKDHIVFGEYIWTDECPYFIDNKCQINDNKPHKCKEYYCEKYFKVKS